MGFTTHGAPDAINRFYGPQSDRAITAEKIKATREAQSQKETRPMPSLRRSSGLRLSEDLRRHVAVAMFLLYCCAVRCIAG
jgi:hypothetical protein